MADNLLAVYLLRGWVMFRIKMCLRKKKKGASGMEAPLLRDG